MIIDERTYQVAPGKMQELLALYEKEGFAIQSKYLGKPFGYFIVEVGEINHIVHMWAYESMADREQKRAQMQADPAWQAYLAKAGPYFAKQWNRVLKSLPQFMGK
jgi:NIPSNAP